MSVVTDPGPDPSPPRPLVNRTLAVAAAHSWRLLAIGLFLAGLAWLAGELLLVLVPMAVAALLSRVLAPISDRLRARGWRPGLAAAAALVGFLIVLAATIGGVGAAIANEADELGPTITEGLDEVEDWLVEDGPVEVERADIERWREQAGDTIARFVGRNGEAVASGAVLVGEIVVGAFLSLIVTFFYLKDGRRFVTAAIDRMPEARRPAIGRAARRGWEALGGFLRGAAVLGAVESVIIGIALWAVGGDLVIPVMVITMLGAFVPIVGAITAGVIATMVALVTAGTGGALVVAAVALIVQQLDNDLLAPVVYGRALQLHPLVVLLGITAAGALFGFVGTIFAVPALAVSINAAVELRADPNPNADDRGPD